MGLKENLRSDPVSRLNLRDPVIASPNASIREGIQRMRERGLGCVIIVDDQRRPLGILNEGMLRQMLSVNPAVVDSPLGDYMNTSARWVRLSDPVVQVLRAMQNEKTRFVGVVDDDGRLAGLTGQKGLMEYVAEHFPEQVTVQRIGQSTHFAQREGA
jgi:CBS domain-containing protein